MNLVTTIAESAKNVYTTTYTTPSYTATRDMNIRLRVVLTGWTSGVSGNFITVRLTIGGTEYTSDSRGSNGLTTLIFNTQATSVILGSHVFPIKNGESIRFGVRSVNAADTSVAYSIEIWEDDSLVPATAGRSLNVDASGLVALQPITHTGATIPTVTTVTNAVTIANAADVTAIKAKTDNLPTDPADQSAIEAAITAATSTLMTAAAYTEPDNTSIAAIKAKTDNLPASPAATGDAMTLTSGTLTSIQSLILSDATPFPGARIDTAISTRSTLTAADVWANGTRTLSSFGTLVADIWAYATRTLSSYGTLVADIWSYSPRVVTVSANGTGSTSWPLTVTDTNGNPIVDVECWLTSDEPGNSLVVHGFTDTAGLVTFSVNPGSYYLWRRKNGWNFATPTAVTIS